MKIIEGKTLADFTTFRIGGKARFFCSIENKEDLQEAASFVKEKSVQIFILGGGSNILVSDKGFEGLVIKIDIRGIEVVSTEADTSFGGLLDEPSRRVRGMGNRGIAWRKNVSGVLFLNLLNNRLPRPDFFYHICFRRTRVTGTSGNETADDDVFH
jgi:UDP-N-acetylmuramate dehydrogenase